MALRQYAQEGKAGLPPVFLMPSHRNIGLRGLHPFIVPGAADISSVTVHKHLALHQGPVLHGAGLRNKKDHFTGQKSLVVARWLE